jgi:hypothetical protein
MKIYDYIYPQGTLSQIQATVDDLASKGWRMVGGLTFTGETEDHDNFYVCTMEIEVVNNRNGGKRLTVRVSEQSEEVR